jgi:hypothetical protein
MIKGLARGEKRPACGCNSPLILGVKPTAGINTDKIAIFGLDSLQ